MSLEPVQQLVRSRLWLRVWATTTFFCAFAGQFLRNLLGYWGFGAFATLVFLCAVAALLTVRPEWRWRWLPKAVFGFLAIVTLSLAWSNYPAGSALGIGTQLVTAVIGCALGLILTWSELLRTLSAALRWILATSLLFELWVSTVVGTPVLPNFLAVEGVVPKAFYWSRNLLLQGGPIEGIVANRNLLGFVALLAVIVCAVQLGAGTMRRGWGIAWLTFSVIMLVLTRSATVTVVSKLVAAAALFALWARRLPAERRWPVYATAGGSSALGIAGVIATRSWLLAMFGKSEDLTGRFDIWDTVVSMWSARPLIGWGWIGYWQPWVEPFDTLVSIAGVRYLQAHNAWLDVGMQIGWLGLLAFFAVAASTLWRSWFLAVDRPRVGLTPREPFAASALLPLLLTVALLGQSLAESRLLVEGNFVLLVVLAVATKQQQWRPRVMP